MNDDINETVKHIQALSVTIGGRGTCTPEERRAAEYACEQMRFLGAQEAHLETFRTHPHTYRPFMLAFLAGLLGILLAWLPGCRWCMAIGAALSLLGGWGMLAETDLAMNWMRLLLPKREGTNAVGVAAPSGEMRKKAVLCAHLDTHRTPIFYSSRTWNLLFSLLVAAAFVSLALGAVFFGLGAAFGWAWVRWIGLGLALFEAFALAMCIQAEFTPYSPGANDNASGVGACLAILRRLREEPLRHTEVWFAFTDSEEAGTYGFKAFLDSHGEKLGRDTLYIILDMVSIGKLTYLTRDGLILKRPTHPLALEVARKASARAPEIAVREVVGLAYTDALSATKRGLPALTLASVPPPDGIDQSHWHRMSDTLDKVNATALADAIGFTWQTLQVWDNL